MSRFRRCILPAWRKSLFYIIILGGSSIISTMTVHAEDMASEIRMLKKKLEDFEAIKARLRALEEKLDSQNIHASTVHGHKTHLVHVHERPQTETQPAFHQEAEAKDVHIRDPFGAAHERVPVSVALPINQTGGHYTFNFNGIRVTPGGYVDLNGIFRSKNLASDIVTPFNSIPYANVPLGHTQEFRGSSRQSRASMLVEADVSPTTHLAGYGEFDFLAAPQTANTNESNSFSPRIRNLYGTVDWDDLGLHLLAGQSWSLATVNHNGIMPRDEYLAQTIDVGYVPGFVWTRQPQLRLAKELLDKKLWIAASLENPATTFYTVGSTPWGTAALPSTLLYMTQGGSFFDAQNQISLNHVPDIIGKVAYEPTIFDRKTHMELFGIYRSIYTRNNFSNHDVAAGGIGGSLIFPLIPKQLTLQLSGLTGTGIGRYGAGLLPDATINANGDVSPIPETILFSGLTWSPTPRLDLYAYAGEEFARATYSTTSNGLAYGYGNPLYDNRGCSVEGASSSTCNGNTKLLRQITGGLWNHVYDGPFGHLKFGLQYSYTQRFGFVGIGGAPKTDEHVFLTSLRFYPF